jgi:hypothetical protein
MPDLVRRVRRVGSVPVSSPETPAPDAAPSTEAADPLAADPLEFARLTLEDWIEQYRTNHPNWSDVAVLADCEDKLELLCRIRTTLALERQLDELDEIRVTLQGTLVVDTNG